MIGSAHIGAWTAIGLGVGAAVGVVIENLEVAMIAGAIVGGVVGFMQSRRDSSEPDS